MNFLKSLYPRKCILKLMKKNLSQCSYRIWVLCDKLTPFYLYCTQESCTEWIRKAMEGYVFFLLRIVKVDARLFLAGSCGSSQGVVP